MGKRTDGAAERWTMRMPRDITAEIDKRAAAASKRARVKVERTAIAAAVLREALGLPAPVA